MIVGYRNRSSGLYPISVDDLRRDAGVLFGEEPPQEVLDALEAEPVEAVAPPAYDPATHSLTEAVPVRDGLDWRQVWVVTPLPPPPVPQEVTRRQAKIILSRVGRLAQADAAIAAMKGQSGEEARIDWVDASVFRRDNPLIVGLGSALGLTSAEIDALFIQAAAIL